MDGIVDDASPIHAHFQIGQAVGGDGIVHEEIPAAKDSADRDLLPLGVDHDVLGPFDHHVAVGQDMRDPGGQGGPEFSFPRGLPLAFQLVAAAEARQGGEGAWRLNGAAHGRDGGGRIRLAAGAGGSFGHGGGLVENHDGDEVVELGGAGIAGEVGQPA